MKKTIWILMAGALLAACSGKKQPVEIVDLPRVETPQEITAAVDTMLAVSDTMPDVNFESVMILKHGNVIYEKWMGEAAPDKPHQMWSVSKSFTATAIGMAIDEGKLQLSDSVISFFPDELPDTISDNLRAMTIRDLLTMNCGQDDEAWPRDSTKTWTRTFLEHPVPHKPGTWFIYNSVGSFMLSAIVQKVTGEKVNDYLTSRLWEPLHIDKPVWDENPQGINCGGWGLNIKTEDMAKFGQLFLQKGQWNGKQLVSENWVNEASKYQVPSQPSGTRPDQIEERGLTKENCAWVWGYGYQMWRCPQDAYRADGLFGQYIFVLPDADAVIAVTSHTDNLQAENDLVYDYLFPVVKALK